jgi:D-alanyl-D-alanine carboxypeptidase (penicillin-binding protein 5/6)
MRLLSVVMKTTGDKLLRFKETKKLFDYGFTHYSQKEIFAAGYSILSQAELPVVKGKAKKVGVVTQKPLSILIKNGDENMYEPVYEIDKSIEKDGALLAPLDKDQVVGSLTVNYKGTEKYEYLTSDGKAQEQVPIAAASQVKKAGWISMLFRGIGELFSGMFKK